MPRVIVIGAGAAGSMAAIFAASAGAETLLLERSRDGGRKILISGGGRCNVLPARVKESRFVTDSSPNLLRKLVRAWPLAAQRAFFETTLGIPLVEEPESAKLFATDEQPGVTSALHRERMHLAQRHATAGHLGFLVSLVAAARQLAAHQRLDEPQPFVATQLRHGPRRVHPRHRHQHRQRRRGTRLARASRARDAPDLRRAYAAHVERCGLHLAVGRLARRHALRA